MANNFKLLRSADKAINNDDDKDIQQIVGKIIDECYYTNGPIDAINKTGVETVIHNKRSSKTPALEPVREYSATVKYYLNIPSMPTTKTIPVDAINKTGVETVIHNKFPNILSLDIK